MIFFYLLKMEEINMIRDNMISEIQKKDLEQLSKIIKILVVFGCLVEFKEKKHIIN